MEPFPVRQSIVFGELPPASGWSRLVPPQRPVPAAEPGTVRVLRINGAYLVEPAGGFTRAQAVAADSVTFVDIAPRTLEISTDLDPPAGNRCCQVLVGFQCRVRDVELVVKAHVTNLFPELDGYLHRIQWYRWFAGASSAQDFALAQKRTVDQINLRPPAIRGLRTELAFVQLRLT